jgi:hypothetical protein
MPIRSRIAIVFGSPTSRSRCGNGDLAIHALRRWCAHATARQAAPPPHKAPGYVDTNTRSQPESTDALEPSKRARPTYHGRPLPRELVGYGSVEGKRRFGEALAAGALEAFFPLSQQFTTQVRRSACHAIDCILRDYVPNRDMVIIVQRFMGFPRDVRLRTSQPFAVSLRSAWC